jgi:plasmid rolling circle replication initiator protein Rep
LPGLNGLHFQELSRAQQRQVRNYPVRTVVFKKESDESLRFQIFERLNTGAMPLNAQEQPRCFSRALKKSLFEANNTCLLCNQHISELDDAAVDHIEMYWLGGKTIEPNARLTHRYCNWARPKSS